MQNPRHLLSEYSRLVVASGVDSQPAREFLFTYRTNEAFVQLARMTNFLLIQLNQQAGRHQRGRDQDGAPYLAPADQVTNL